MNRAAAGPARVVRIPCSLEILAVDEVRLGRELHVQPAATLLLRIGPLQVDVERWIRRGVRPRVGRALVLVVQEVMDAVLTNGAAVGGAQLLVGIWQNLVLDKVLGVESTVTKVAGEAARRRV